MTDDNRHSANNFVRDWIDWKNKIAHRDALYGPNRQVWDSVPIEDTRNVAISCAGAGLIIGMFTGALTAQNDGLPLLEGFLLGCVKGMLIGAVFGYLLSKFCVFWGKLGLNDAIGGALGVVWQGIKWGALAGLILSLIVFHTSSTRLLLLAAVAGAVINVARRAGKTIFKRRH